MNILIITQYHPPEMGAAATRWSDYANILSEFGHAITVLCEVPNYPTGIISAPYKNFKVHVERSDTRNYQIIRVPVWVNRRSTSLERMGFYLSFMVSSMVVGLKLKRYDAVIVSSPPLFVGLTGILLRKIKGSPLILDLRDLWPESAIVLGELKGRLSIRVAKIIEKRLYQTASHFLLAVPGFSNHLDAFPGIGRNSIVVPLLNGVSRRFIRLVQETVAQQSPRFTVVYAGNLGLAQGLDLIIKVANHLSDLDIVIRIIGHGVQKEYLVKLKGQLGLTNVQFTGPLNKSDLVTQIKAADISLVPLVNSKLFRHALPSKLFEMMACGTPPIVSVKGDVETIIRQAKCGVCIEPEDEKALETAIRAYYHDPVRTRKERVNGMEFIRKHMVKEIIAESTFGKVLKAL